MRRKIYGRELSRLPKQRAKQKAKRDYSGSPSSNNNLLLISVDLFQSTPN